MSNRSHRSVGTQTSLIRTCKLCGVPKTIEPASEQHLKAHVARRIAFVCIDCAEQIRLQVEMAGTNQGISA